jgi:NADPH:quinone reductase-like Zn-dependent oxidoreductase
MVFAVVRAEVLERLVPLIEAGSVVPSIDRTFPLADAAEAMDYLESGAVRGKVVLTV